MELLTFYVDDLIKTALTEDISYMDSTTDLLIPHASTSTAHFIARGEGVISGFQIALRTFTLLDDTVAVKAFVEDGTAVHKGDIIGTVSGHTDTILKGERTALNILQHMSGISTYTARCVAAVASTNASIVDTRKTLPGLRAIEKYAVLMGGGKNHRYNLSDGAMLKDNHIDAYGGITAAVAALRTKASHMLKIEVETRNLPEVKEALAANVDVIMLDNMSCKEMAEAVNYCRGCTTSSKCLIEASGDVTLENILEVANTGVDIISLGALTHDVTAFNVSLKIDKPYTDSIKDNN